MDFLDRLKQEKKELEDKEIKLRNFLSSENAKIKVGDKQYHLLGIQSDVMRTYLNILTIRIEDLDK